MPDAVGEQPWYSRTLHERGVAWVMHAEADAVIARLQRENVALRAERRSLGRLAASDAVQRAHHERETDAP